MCGVYNDACLLYMVYDTTFGKSLEIKRKRLIAWEYELIQ